jgi:hypothetical protein
MPIPTFPIRRNRPRYSHAIQLYHTDTQLMSEVGEKVRATLERGDSAIVIATKSHRAALGEFLLEHGLDLSNPMLKQRYFESDAAEMLSQFMVSDYPDAASFAEIIGRVLVRARSIAANRLVFAFGEMVALLWADGNKDGAIRLERLWNDQAHSHSFNLHCAYPQSAFRLEDHDDLFEICAEHSQLISPSAGC